MIEKLQKVGLLITWFVPLVVDFTLGVRLTKD